MKDAKKDIQKTANIFRDAEALYEIILNQLDIDKSDELYANLVLGMLRRQTKDHLIFSIWNSLDEAQSQSLRNFINQTSITMPWMTQEDALMEFAMMYPALMENVYAGLSVFFQNFIKKFNEISRA